MQAAVTAVVLLAGFGIVAMISIASSPGNYLYYAGLILVVIYGYTFLKLRFIWATLAGWMIVIAYEIVAVQLTQDPILVLINNNFFFLSGNILGMVLAYSTEYHLRKEFIQTRLLEVEQQKVSAANRKLEKRVEERTAQLVQANKELKDEIAERKRIETELHTSKEIAEAANRAKSEFLANMSHELRTPLNHIIGFTELVVDKNFGDLNETQEEYLHDVLSSSRHLLSLINDILDLSKVEAGKLELEATEVILRKVLEQSLNMFKEKANKHKISLTTDIDEIPMVIIADERKLKQILYNLLSNAVKFTPEGGTICLSAKRVADSELRGADFLEHVPHMTGAVIAIAVQDTGIGLKQEDLTRIFNPFEQVEHTAKRRYQGTGLGLSLTKRLVELHGGLLWGESDGEGKGSKFTFVIPI
jgi:signal transduction histidine kinase